MGQRYMGFHLMCTSEYINKTIRFMIMYFEVGFYHYDFTTKLLICTLVIRLRLLVHDF